MKDSDYRIKNMTAISMISLAGILDAVKFFLDLTLIGDFLTWIVPFIAVPIFLIWFLVKGVNYNGSKGAQNMVVSIGATVVDVIPFINMIPATTLGVVTLIVNSRIEDAKKHKQDVQKEKAVAMARFARMQAMQSQRKAQAMANQLPQGLRASEG